MGETFLPPQADLPGAVRFTKTPAILARMVSKNPVVLVRMLSETRAVLVRRASKNPVVLVRMLSETRAVLVRRASKNPVVPVRRAPVPFRSREANRRLSSRSKPVRTRKRLG